MTDPEKMLVVLRDPKSALAESYRGLRTSIQRALGGGVRSLMLVSVYGGDGKSTVCCNIAAGLTQLFLEVVLVDGDLRRPTITSLFGLTDRPGLSNYLAGTAKLEDVICETGIPHLKIVPAGTATDNPGDLLGRPALSVFCRELGEKCDVAIYDTSPLSACSDALAMGPHIDTTAIVINPKRWDGEVEVRVRQSLDAHNVAMLGVILNGIDVSEGSTYGYGYGYGRYGYGSAQQAYGYGYEPAEKVSRDGKTGVKGWLSWLLGS